MRTVILFSIAFLCAVVLILAHSSPLLMFLAFFIGSFALMAAVAFSISALTSPLGGGLVRARNLARPKVRRLRGEEIRQAQRSFLMRPKEAVRDAKS